MTKRELHHQPPSCEPKCCPQPCNCRYDPWRFWFLFILILLLFPCILILSTVAIKSWYRQVDYVPPAVVSAIYGCADNGPLHGRGLPNDRRGRTGYVGTHPGDGSAVPGGPNAGRPGPPAGPHRQGLNEDDEICRAIKAIIDQSIDHDAIAELTAEKTCKKCGENDDDDDVDNGDDAPLVLGGNGVAIEIKDNPACAGDVITGITVDNTPVNPNQKVRFDEEDLDLPQFCPTSNDKTRGPDNGRRLNTTPATPYPDREWELLERPRVHHTRTHAKPFNEDNDLVGGPYAVFIAKHLDGICCERKKGGEREAQAVRDKDRITVFILYLDWVTEQPTIIEFDVEVERGKGVVSDEDTVQLIQNVRLNSLRKEISFQIGQGARRIVIAGYDFGPTSTSTDTGLSRRSEQDTSGSYRIGLSEDAAVEWVQRID